MNGWKPETFVSQKDIQELTKRVRFSAQTAALRKMGFTVINAPDGEPKVTTENFLHVTDSSFQQVFTDEVILNGEFL